MKNCVKVALFAILFLFTSGYLSAAQNTPKTGLVVGESVISPGDQKEYIFAFFGVPDGIYAMRGKGGKKHDYVKLYYSEQDLSFDLNNEDNTIRAIIIKGVAKIKNVPFKVGDTYDSIKAKWGEPDKKEAGYANYMKAGVMFKISDTGKIELIALFLPGTMDSKPPSQSSEQA